MGAFYFYNKNTKIDKEALLSHLKRVGFKNYFSFDLGQYILILYQKRYLEINNFYENESYSVFANGSFFYKGLGYNESLKKVFDDYSKGALLIDKLYGNYIFFFYNKRKNTIAILTDPVFIKNVYIDFHNNIISSNFLAIIESRPYFYNWNKLALYESIISGNLIPPDTYADGIERINKNNINKIDEYFKQVNTIKPQRPKFISFSGFDDAVDHANNLLHNYFKSISRLDKEFGSHIGLTAGLDSRLLLIHALPFLKKLNVNSFYRENSKEYFIAKKIANKINIEFRSYEYSQKKHINVIPYSAYLFLDGQIRSQNFYDEEFNMPNYGNYLYRGHYLGFHGCGGEQYRNADRFKRKISLYDFVIYEWMFKQSGKLPIKQNIKNNLIENIYAKIKKTLNIQHDEVDLLLFKRIQNEIWNQANRATRVNALNQQMLYFAPFTEWQLSLPAYSYVPFLGNYFRFQLEMMRRLNGKLNELNTNYGFSINKGPTTSQVLFSNIASIIPRKYLLYLHRIMKRNSFQEQHRKKEFIPLALTELSKEMGINRLLKNKYQKKNLIAYELVINNMKLQ